MVVVGEGSGTVVVDAVGTVATGFWSGGVEDGAPAVVIVLVRIPVADRTVDPPIDPSTMLAVTARPVVETAAASNAEASRPIRRRAGLPGPGL